MRVLIATPTFPPYNSGLGNAVLQQALYIQNAGHDVVIATGGSRREQREFLGLLVEVFNVSGARYGLNCISGDVCTYRDFLRTEVFDVVILNAWQTWSTDIALRQLRYMNGRKFVYSHCISTNTFFFRQPVRSLVRYFAWRPYWWGLPRVMKALDGVIFLSSNGTDSRFDDLRLAKKLGIKYFVVPNALSDAASAKLSVPSKELLERDSLVAVGSYTWQKGFDFVIRAFSASSARKKMKLHLFGQEATEYCKGLEALVSSLGLNPDSVVFHEGVSGSELISKCQNAKLILSGSCTECQPLVLVDAAAVGTPFIARSTGCIASMAGGVTVSTISEMAAEIDRLLANWKDWQRFSDAGRREASVKYHSGQSSRKLLEVIER